MPRWRELRAGSIALVIFFGLVDGCPIPPPEHTPDWKKSFVEPIREAQQIVLTPVAWIRPRLRVTQRWALYQAPDRDRYRLWIEGQEANGRWRILFRAADDEHDEDAALLDYSRTRGAWDPTGRMPLQYSLFARWVTRYMLDKHPELIAARMRLEEVRVIRGGFVPKARFGYMHVTRRGDP